MGQLIVTAVLASLVVGGGVFIFWPDLSSKLPKKKEKQKKPSKEQVNAREIYRNYYTTTDELIELSNLMQDGMDKDSARDKLVERGDSIVEMLSNPNGQHHVCPVCHQDNRIQAGITSMRCRCDGGEFRKKVHSMVVDAGHNNYY